jgi:hypothetical protein
MATRVNDPLTVTALALESGDGQVVFVSMDLCSVDDEVLSGSREILRKRLPDFDPLKMIVSATHTHTAPFTGSAGLQKEEDYIEAIRTRYPDYISIDQYTQMVVEAVVSAVCEAWASRAEGYIGWGYSFAVVGENRRVCYSDGRTLMYGSVAEGDFSHIEGHVDHGVNLVFTYDAERKLTGMVVNLACPSQASEGAEDYVSADFWHDTRMEIRHRCGDGLHILPQCSAAGDQSPHRQLQARAEERMLRLKYGGSRSTQANFALRRDIARRIADAVDDAEPSVRQELHDAPTLVMRRHELDLPHWKVTDAEYAALQQEMGQLQAQLEGMSDADPLDRAYTHTHFRLAWCKRAVDRYLKPLDSVPIEMSVVRLGDIAFVTAPFEYYLDFGDRIKGRSEALQTFIIQLAGSHRSDASWSTGGGYLPTERATRGLSYGAVPASCRVSPQGGQVIVDQAIATIGEMFAEQHQVKS